MQTAVVFFLPFLNIVWFHSSSEQENLNFYENWGKSLLTFVAEYLTDSYESNRFICTTSNEVPEILSVLAEIRINRFKFRENRSV